MQDLNRAVEIVLEKHPSLFFDADKGKFQGEIEIEENDFYEIEVDINPFPKFFPDVYEIGDRIPQKVDRHKFQESNKCCLTTLAKSQILLKTKILTLPDFFQKILVPYFQNNSYYEINNSYFQGEHSHGTIGILEGYQDILGISDPLAIGNLIYGRVVGEKLTIRDLCFCGNGKTLKKCATHMSNYRSFRLIERDVLISDLNEICDLIEQIRNRSF